MKRMPLIATVAALFLCLSPVRADDPPKGEMPQMSEEEKAMMGAWMKAMTPAEPHALLAKSTGTWTMKLEMWMEPGADPQISMGTAERQMILGGRVIEERVQATMMGEMPFEGIGHTGYDNVTERYWSTWMDTAGTAVAITHGTRDPEQNALVFEGTMTDPMVGEKPFRSVVRSPDASTEVFEMYETRDGEEVLTVRITYRRK